MRMNIGEREGICLALLRVEADRYSLHHADVINRTFLIKISQCDVPLSLSIRIGVIGVGTF
jgi:hypothetical protein